MEARTETQILEGGCVLYRLSPRPAEPMTEERKRVEAAIAWCDAILASARR
jgi:hypothetical protein